MAEVETTSQRVVAGVDSSTRAREAALWAASEATTRAAELHLVHAYFHPDFLAEEAGNRILDSAQQLLDDVADACETACPRLVVRTHAVAGAAVPALVERSAHAQLLVVGDRGSGGFTGLMAGSVSLALPSRAACPVVVVRTEEQAQLHSAGPVVLGLAHRDDDEAVLRFGFDTAMRSKCHLVAVHGWTSGLEHDFLVAFFDAGASFEDHFAQLRSELEHRLASSRRAHPTVPAALRLVHNPAAEALIDEARRSRARLVVVGTRHSYDARISLGATNHALLHHSPSPVGLVAS